MDDSLQRWCAASLALARRQCSAAVPQQIDLATAVEQAVETAAFQKMAKASGKLPANWFDRSRATDNIDELVARLEDSCPVTENEPLESLGLIHQYLVAQRIHSTTQSPSHAHQPRKVNGVFYTPRHIVEYIVEQTVSRRLESMTPQQVEHFAILDPAAGSGAFLLAAYRRLLEWHLKWFTNHEPNQWPSDIENSDQGWRLTPARRRSILSNLFGVDLDAGAIETARRTLWLESLDGTASSIPVETINDVPQQIAGNLRHGHALVGPAFGETSQGGDGPQDLDLFNWTDQFPQIASRGGFDIVIGNPPYRRERNYKRELDAIAATALGRHRSPRMDLWYYFVHRGIQLLRDEGMLSFITTSYWIHGKGAEKLIAALRDEVHLEELFLLLDHPIFPGVEGRHQILRLTKSHHDGPTSIKILGDQSNVADTAVADLACARAFFKTPQQLFGDGTVNIWPPAEELFAKLESWPPLVELGKIRQGIAENPAAVNRRTLDRFHDESTSKDWKVGEGVFSLRFDEQLKLELQPHEVRLLRPYHDLCDLGRYWLAAEPSRRLIYSTRATCPDIADFPQLHQHLSRFRAIMNSRRETRKGSNQWWHLHWPRDERVWMAEKLIVLQMAVRPSFVPAFLPTYVPFSANVFVPECHIREDLKYLSALLNSKVMWAWFNQRAKHRGIGLELNGHILEKAPIRRIDFSRPEDVRGHQRLVELVDQRMKLEQARVSARPSPDLEAQILAAESEIDATVAALYRLDSSDLEYVDGITRDIVRSKIT